MSGASKFLDTNILVYAIADDAKAVVARGLMAAPFVISAQCLNEFANVGRRKLGMSWSAVENYVRDIRDTASEVIAVEPDMTETALRLAPRYNLAFYDALMVAAALKTDCDTYFSEDLHHGLVVDEKLTIVNPFR